MAQNQLLLPRSFFQGDTRVVAQALLGKILHFRGSNILINETEAYMGFEDPASHAYRGKTPRNAAMFGPAGFSYVYLIYGMYHCLNITTGRLEAPSAVLIRGGYLLDGTHQKVLNLNGPGKLCRHLGITRMENGIDLLETGDFFVKDHRQTVHYIATPRIGIKQGLDKFWRFVEIA